MGLEGMGAYPNYPTNGIEGPSRRLGAMGRSFCILIMFSVGSFLSYPLYARSPRPAVSPVVHSPTGKTWYVQAIEAEGESEDQTSRPSPLAWNLKSPQIQSFECRDPQNNNAPAPCWWGRRLVIRGCDFSPVARDNVIYLNPRPVWVDEVALQGSCGELTVREIPDGVFSTYLRASRQGVMDLPPPKGHFLSMIPPVEFSDIRSVIGMGPADAMRFLVVSVREDMVQGSIIEGLYSRTPRVTPWAGFGGSVATVSPYVSRERPVNASPDEVCWVEDVDHGPYRGRDVYCAVVGGSKSRVAHLDGRVNGTFFAGPLVGQVRGIAVSTDTSTDTRWFYVAYEAADKPGWYRIERVRRGNTPSDEVDIQFGNMDFRIVPGKKRVGMDADVELWVAAGMETPGCSGRSGQTCMIYILSNETVVVAGTLEKPMEDVEIEWRWWDGHGHVWYLQSIGALGIDWQHDLYNSVFARGKDGSTSYQQLQVNTLHLPRTTAGRWEFGSKKVVISSAPRGVQEAAGWPEAEQVAPRVIRVPVQVGFANHPVYLRVLDPPDLAGYAPVGCRGRPECMCPEEGGPFLQACDNQVWQVWPAPADWGLCAALPCTNPVRVLQTGSDGQGKASVYLKLPMTYSGDNLVLQIHYAPLQQAPQGSEPVLNYSEIYTGWKRVFVEADFMFRYGGLLAVNCNRCNQIVVYPWSNVQVGDIIVVFTEPRTNVQTTFPYLPGSQAELRRVRRVQTCPGLPPCNQPGVRAGDIVLELECVPGAPGECSEDGSLTGLYEASERDNEGRPTFKNGRSAGVGVVHREVRPSPTAVAPLRSKGAGWVPRRPSPPRPLPSPLSKASAAPLWFRAYGEEGLGRISIWALVPAPLAGDFIAVGDWNDGSNLDGWLAMIDAQGHILWERRIGNADSWEGFWSAVVTTDGYILALGWAYAPLPDGSLNPDIWVARLGPLGHLMWQKRYGAIDPMESDPDCRYGREGAVAAVSTADGGLLLLAGVEFTPRGFPCFRQVSRWGPWVLRLDRSGNVEWHRMYSSYTGSDFYVSLLSAMTGMPDGGVAITGRASLRGGDDDLWVLRLDEQGEVVWNKVYMVPGEDMGLDIASWHKGLIAVGLRWPFHDRPGGWALRLDGAGAVVWQKAYGQVDESEGNGRGFSFVRPRDEGIIVAGWIETAEDPLWVLRLSARTGDALWQKRYSAGGWPSAMTLTSGNVVIAAGLQALLTVNPTDGGAACGLAKEVEATVVDTTAVAADAWMDESFQPDVEDAPTTASVYSMTSPEDDLCQTFTLSLQPDNVTVRAGESVALSSILTSVNGFSGDVSLACEEAPPEPSLRIRQAPPWWQWRRPGRSSVSESGGLPEGFQCTFDPNPVTLSGGGKAESRLTITVGPDVLPGLYGIPVTAKGRRLRVATQVALAEVLPGKDQEKACRCKDFPICHEVSEACFWRADLGNVAEPFSDAFILVSRYPAVVDPRQLGEGEGAVPYLPEFVIDLRSNCEPFYAMLRFHQIWFAHRSPEDRQYENCDPCVGCGNFPQNYFHVIGGTQEVDGGALGVSVSISDVSFVFGQSIETLCRQACTPGPEKMPNVYRSVTNHELVHQFEVNEREPCTEKTKGHDDHVAWCGQCGGPHPIEKCLMHLGRVLNDKEDGVDRLDCYNLIGSMENPVCRAEIGKIWCGEVLRTTSDPK